MAAVEVVSAFGGLAAYIEAVGAMPTVDRRELYHRLVLDPTWDRCLAGSELEDRGRALLDASSGDLTRFAHAAAVVERSGVRRVIEEAFWRSAALLPGPDTTVGLFPLDPGNDLVVERMYGVLGWTAGAGKIVILVTSATDWLDWVPYTVAHEHHHSVWRAAHPGHGDFSLLEYLIFEGRADSFAALVYPGVVASLTVALTAVEEGRLWRAMREKLNSRDRSVTWPFLSGDERIPRWAGYTVGYRIVQAYLRNHSRISVEEWSALEPEKLLRESGYDYGPTSPHVTTGFETGS